MWSDFAGLDRIDRLIANFALISRVGRGRVHRRALRLRRLLLVHIDAEVLVLGLLTLIDILRAVVAALIIQHERVPQAILLDPIALGERAAVVHHLAVVLRERVVLQLLELVAGGQVTELLAPVVVEDGARGLLVVARAVADDDGVCWRHGHGAHAHWDDVGSARVDAYRVALRHGRHHNVLHDLAELRRQIRIELAHLHRWYCRALAHVADDDLLVGTVVVQLRRRLLEQHLALGNSRSFLARVLRLLARALRWLILRLICLLDLR